MFDTEIEKSLHPENFETHETDCEDSNLEECICPELREREVEEYIDAQIDEFYLFA